MDVLTTAIGILQGLKDAYDMMEYNQKKESFLLSRVFVLEPVLKQMQHAKCTSSPALDNVLETLKLFKVQTEKFLEPTYF